MGSKSVRQDLMVPVGWRIRSVVFHHDLAYWGMWALQFLSSLVPGVSTTPPAADVSYMLYRESDGAVQAIRLSGDHAPDALVQAIRVIEAAPAVRKS